MPAINEYKCSKCDFKLPEGWGTLFYVIDDQGYRVHCLHPGEQREVEEVLGKHVPIETVWERTGFVSHCVR